MSPIPDDPNQAQAWISGEAPDQTIDFYIPRGNRGPIGPTGPQGPSLLVGEVVTSTGPAVPGTAGPQGLTGPKGDPGGFTAATDLNTSDLNLIVTPGIYTQNNSSGADSPLSNNYPFAGAYGILMVTVTNGADLIQQFTPQSYAAGRDAKIFYVRNRSNNVWSPWRSYSSTRFDQAAGRALYLWDEINNREQLVWGDTGRRDISAMCSGSFGGGKAAIRREGSMVEIYLVNWIPGSATQLNLLATGQSLPNGYRPSNSRLMWGFQGNSPIPISVGYDGTTINITPNHATNYVACSINWSTTDPWPTTLIGTADGAIPTV